MDDYIISITGSQIDGNDEQEISMTTTGSYYKDNDNYYISYLETDDLGIPNTTTTLEIDPSQVNIIREGGIKSKMILQKGRRHLCAYETGMGHLMVGICAESISADLTETGGQLYFSYAMDINSELAGTNRIHISIKENKCNVTANH